MRLAYRAYSIHQSCAVNPLVFTKTEGDIIILVIYVDDLVTGSDEADI